MKLLPRVAECERAPQGFSYRLGGGGGAIMIRFQVGSLKLLWTDYGNGWEFGWHVRRFREVTT